MDVPQLRVAASITNPNPARWGMTLFAVSGRGKWGPGTGTVHVSVSAKEPDDGIVANSTPMKLTEPGPIRLLEYTPWLMRNRGPQNSVGVVYFIRGFVGGDRDDDRHQAPQYFLRSFSEAGWDVIYAKYPQSLVYPGNEEGHDRPAEFVAGRMQELKSTGYCRVILGGQSWGAWISMTAARTSNLAADGLLLLVPAAYGKKVTLDGEPNPSFLKNRAANDDFRSILTQLSPDSRQRLLADQELVGRSHVVYSAAATTDLYLHKSADILIRHTRSGRIGEAYSLKDGGRSDVGIWCVATARGSWGSMSRRGLRPLGGCKLPTKPMPIRPQVKARQ
jgi:pimeloyl-ACP methyl ester carboxylesterase